MTLGIGKREFVGDYRDRIVEASNRFGLGVDRFFVGDYRDQIVKVEQEVQTVVDLLDSSVTVVQDRFFVGDYRDRIMAGEEPVRTLFDDHTTDLVGNASDTDASATSAIAVAVDDVFDVYFHLKLDTSLTYPNGKVSINVTNDDTKLEVSYDDAYLELKSASVVLAKEGTAKFTFKALQAVAPTQVSVTVVDSLGLGALTITPADVTIA